ncbi:MAG TPA: response regulator transcription factor [Actinomycetota bacterium]|nr:response regulator transcription factor [Actinomycetota bacterium]
MPSRVLIADDVPDIRLFLHAMLTMDGYFEVVGEASSGEEALQKSRDAQPDVVLLDMNMPGRSGLDVLPDIRAALPRAIIAVFSGFEERALGQRTLHLGADVYLEKGTPAFDVVERLKSLVEARGASSDQ